MSRALLRVALEVHCGPGRQATGGMRNPHNIGDLVEAIELAEATQRREAGERAPPFPRRVHLERRKPEGTSRPVGRLAVPGPQDEPMPTDPPRSPNRAWLAGCIVHHEPPLEAPWVEVKVNGRPYQALLDSGSAFSLVQLTVLPPRGESKALLPITCVHGDTRRVPARRVTISAAPGSWSVEVGIVKDLPVPVLLGRDWPGFDRLLAAATQPVSPTGNRRRRRSNRGPRERPVLLASDSARDGESPSQTTTHPRGALRADRDGSDRAAAKVRPGSRTHHRDSGLRHSLPGSHSPSQSHFQGHRSGAVPPL